MGKAKNDRPATDVDDAPGVGAAEPSSAAATGSTVEAKAEDAAGSNEKPADAEAAGQVPGKADADADAADAEISEPDEAPMTVAQLARECAALADLYASGLPIDIDAMVYTHQFEADEAEIMAAFVAENPDAPLLAMNKHLELAKKYPPVDPNNEDLLALELFHAACMAARRYEQREAAEAVPPVPQSSGFPGEQAFQVTDQPFQPTGFSVR